MERATDNVPDKIANRAEGIERAVNGIADRAKEPAVIVHPYAAGDVSVKILNLEIVGLPAFDRLGLQRQIAEGGGNSVCAFEHIGGFRRPDDPLCPDLGQLSGRKHNRCPVVLDHVTDLAKPPKPVEEVVARGSDEFIVLAIFDPG